MAGCEQPIIKKKDENIMKKTKCSIIGFVSGGVMLGALTGCVGYVDEPRGGGAYAGPPSGYVESGVVMQPEYVYYPGYEVYYSHNTRQYTYREGRSWVSRTAPPHVSAEVLIASPSVRLDFHDSPSVHHAEVVKQYPRHWSPPAANHGGQEGHNERN
jgi:hypothetical protein